MATKILDKKFSKMYWKKKNKKTKKKTGEVLRKLNTNIKNGEYFEYLSIVLPVIVWT